MAAPPDISVVPAGTRGGDSGVGSAIYQESENVEQAYVTEDEDSLEDLTSHFLLNLFSKSGINNSQVKKLGIFLEVPEHQVTQISHANPNEPAVQAMNVCLKWINQHEMDKKTAYNKLDSALSFIKLGRVAKYLSGGKRPISQFSGEVFSQPYVWSKVERMTDEQARVFGFQLSLSERQIDEAMRSEGGGGLKAKKMYHDWQRDCRLSKSAMVKKFNGAVETATSHEDDSSEKTRLIKKRGDKRRPRKQHVPDDDDDEIRPFCKPKVYMIIILILTWVLLILSIVAMSIALILLPNVDGIEIILSGNIIVIPLPFFAPPKIELQLYGENDDCQATVLATTCDKLKTDNITLENPPKDFVYLLKGSRVTIRKQVSHLPYSIWIFDSIHEANHAVRTNFGELSCDSYRHGDRGIQCGTLSPVPNHSPLVFDITHSSYYFLRCQDYAFNCTDLQQWQYSQLFYNLTQTISDELHINMTLYTQDVSVQLKLRSQFFPHWSSSHNVCILVELEETTCGSHGNKYFLSYKYTSWSREISLYVSFGLGAWLVILIVITCRVYRVHIKKKELIQ